MLAVVAIGVAIHGEDCVYITAHIGQMLRISCAISILPKIGSEAVDVGSIDVCYIIGDFIHTRTQFIRGNGNGQVFTSIGICR